MEPTSKPMSIQGPFHNERQRLTGAFTDEDRKWRKQWLKDQELSHNEPRPIPEYKNPIRRAYRFPLDFVFSKLESTLVSCILLRVVLCNEKFFFPFSVGQEYRICSLLDR